MLRSARTVIVDEIHAVAANKRGSHLALTLERLAHVAAEPVQRVGLSATQRPIETIARLLVGSGQDRDNPDGTPRCAIVDSGHRRPLDLALELPDDELGAVPTTGQMAQILDMIAGHVTGHRTTLVFVNTRSMAARSAAAVSPVLTATRIAGALSPSRPDTAAISRSGASRFCWMSVASAFSGETYTTRGPSGAGPGSASMSCPQ